MASLEAVEQDFIANLTRYLGALDDGIAKASEFARANQEAEDAVVAMANAVNDAAVAVGADMSAAAGRVNDLRDAFGTAGRAADAAGRDLVDAGIAAGLAGTEFGGAADRIAAVTVAADDAEAALGDLRTRLAGASAASGGLSRSFLGLMGRAVELRAVLGILDDELEHKIADLGGVAAAARAVSVAAVGTTAAAADANRGFRIWGTGIRLTGAAIHWLLAGTAEFLAVGIPALIAGAAGAFVLYQGAVEQVIPRMQALYTTTEATSSLLHKTAGDVLGLGHAWQTAQDAANPLAWELLGAYINGAKTSMHGLADAGLQVDQIFARFAAKLDVDMRQGATQIAGLLHAMVPDLVEFGQIVGNIGHAILNFASDMPGLAEVLLKVADAISTVIRWISELPRGLILGFMAFEEFIRWGGLLSGMLAPLILRLGMLASAAGADGLGIALTNASTSMTVFAGASRAFFGLIGNMITQMVLWGRTIVATYADLGVLAGTMELLSAVNPMAWIAIAVAALAGLALWLGRTKTGAQALATTLDTKLADASSLTTIPVATDNIRQLDQALQQTGSAASDSLGALVGKLTTLKVTTHDSGHAFSFLGQTIEAALGGNVAASPLGQLTNSLKLQQSAIGQAIDGANKLSRVYGTSFVQSLALADAAGVNLGKTQIIMGKDANVAGQQIENMVTGYKRMDQVGGILGADMNVLAIQAGLANTQVGKLNQGWDQFVQNATSLTSTIATLNQDVTQIGNVGVKAGQKFSVFSGQYQLSLNKAALALRSFTGTGAQAWQNYDSALGSAQQYMDALRTATAYGGVTQKQFRQAAAYSVAELLPLAAHSKTATEELSALAQEAGGPATGNFQQLKQWVDSNKISAQQYAQIIQQLTGQMSNAGAAAKEFASTLQSAMQERISNALLGTERLNQTVGQFSRAVQASGGTITATSPAYKAMYDFFTASGFTAQEATAQIKLMMGQIDGTAGAAARSTGPLGAMRGAISGVGNEAATAAAAVRAVALAIDALHSKTVYVDVVQQGAGLNVAGGGGLRITGGGGAYGQVQHKAGGGTAHRGLAVVGEEGPELMWMRGGEHVLPAGPTAAILRMAKSMPSVHGYAGGTSDFTKLLHLLERDFRLIENGLRVHLKGPAGVWFPSIAKAVEEIRRDFKKHLISRDEELKLLRLAEARNKRLEGIAARHAESRDLHALANLFAPKHHAAKMIGPIADLMKQVEREHGAGVIGKKEEGRLVRLLRHDNSKLLELERDRSRILTRLKNAEHEYLAKIAAERQYAASVTSAAESSASLSAIMSGQGGPVSSSYLLASMRIDLSQIRKFDADIKKLEKLGLDKALLNQIIQMGPAQGDQVAQALINGPLSNIKALNATEAKVAAASRHLGQSASREMYGAGIRAAQGLVKGLEREKKHIEKVMESVARDMARALDKALGIHHRHGPAHKTGHAVMDAIGAGAAERAPALGSALRTAAGHVSSALGTAAGVSGGWEGTAEVTVPVTVMIDGKVLFRSVQTQSLRTDRRNGAANTSLRRGRGQQQ